MVLTYLFRFVFWGGVLVVLTVLLVVAVGTLGSLAGEEQTPSGLLRNESRYLEMRDGTRIAIDIWLPSTLKSGETVPTIVQMTRYWRAYDIRWFHRALAILGIVDEVRPQVSFFNRHGYAYVLVDARGSGASFGSRAVEMGVEEIDDYDQVVTWVAKQSWSNGKLGAWGISYDGNTAELLASRGNPALKAVALLFSDYDPYRYLLRPGGAMTNFTDQWGAMVGEMDENNVCGVIKITGFVCRLFTWAYSGGVKPVASDPGALSAAISEHKSNQPVGEAFGQIEFIDDAYGSSGIRLGDLFPSHYSEAVQHSDIPMLVWVGWLDAATVDGALERYLGYDNYQELIIAPLSHGGRYMASPWSNAPKPASPAQRDQLSEHLEFFNRYLSPSHRTADTWSPGKGIRYYTFGWGWRHTGSWPPAGSDEMELYLGTDRKLLAAADMGPESMDSYQVDFSASTGDTNRWITNIRGAPVVYPDRRDADSKLLVYTSAPVSRDIVISGAPSLKLYIKTTEPDMVLHTYLEIVAPDGKVTYITEGVLRLVNSPTESRAGLPSFKRKDALPLPLDRVKAVDIQLINTSVWVKRGHRIRVALAGADSSIFERWPVSGQPRLTVKHSGRYPSRLWLPVERFSPQPE